MYIDFYWKIFLKVQLTSISIGSGNGLVLYSVPGVSHYPNTLGPRQNGQHFADGIFRCIFLNENV